jgi:hypothetical protein
MAGTEIVEGPIKTIIASYITGCSYPLGEYSNKAKAMKVLDMIQEAYEEYKITRTFLTGFTGHRAIVESNDIHVNGFEELVKSFKKNMVFQMPADSEVEVRDTERNQL